MTVEEVLAMLRAKARPGELEGMARFGIGIERRLGVAVPDMRAIAKRVGTNHRLALALWRTRIPDARIVASIVADSGRLTEDEMDAWVKDFDSWDVCDQVCMNLFEKTPLAWKKARDWSSRPEEFVRRASFALIACLAWHDKKAGNGMFIDALPLLAAAATDERNYVKKAVSWALRNIGKRNPALRKAALEAAHGIGRIGSKTARWIASDAVKELEKRPAAARRT